MDTPGRAALLHAGVAACLLAGYVGLAWAGRELGDIGSLTVWYPPAGLAIVASLLLGWRITPVLAVAEVVAGLVVFDAGSFMSAPLLVVNASGYAAIWGVGGEVLRRGVADVRRLLGQVLLALGVGVVATPLAAAAFGVAMQRWAGLADQPFGEAVGVWWTGDAVGVASIAPTLLVLWWSLRQRGPGDMLFDGRRVVPLAVHLASPMVVAAVVFATSGQGIRFPYLVLIPVVLVALRYGIAGAAISTLGLAPLVTSLVDGLESAETIDRAELQALLLVGIGTGLIVGTVVTDRERIGRLHRELGSVIEATPDLVSIVDADGRVRYLNPAARAVAGVAADIDLRDVRDTDLAVGELDAEHTEQTRLAAHRDGTWWGDVTLTAADGHRISGSKVVIVHPERNGAPPRITSIVRDLSKQRRLEQQLTRRALYDAVTGLPNRALFLERLAHARSRRPDVVVLLAAVDRFAMIDEGAGHPAGDTVAREVGRRIVERLEVSDTVAHLDPGTFGIILDRDVDALAAATIGDRLLAEVGGLIETASGPVPVTVNIGAVQATPDLRTEDEVLRAAEVAARRALDVGGGARTVLYSERMADTARRRLAIELDLRDAITSHRWWLAYQPIIDVATGRVVSCEALLRWTDPAGEPVSPYELILLAEETGLIVPLGQSVLQRACLESLGWADHGTRITVAVNVSARQLAEPGFTDSVAEVLRHTGIDPGVITVELTETSFAGDPDSVRPLLDDLIALGVEVAMDDFGTGYSSLAQLGGLPLSKVKLDKSFIDDLVTSERCRDLVDGVITLAHALGLTVVAEGVEQDAQLDILRALGCDRAQGYLFSHPISPEELRERLRSAPPPDAGTDAVTRALIDKFG